MNGRVAVVLGTRPEIIKLAGVISGLADRCYVVHTGQHYDDELSETFLRDFRLPKPEILLDSVGGQSRSRQFAEVMRQLGEHFATDPPAAVVVQGDTNTAAAAAQAASFAETPVVHVEAGLRSFDRVMPEEINRRLIGVVADLHCAPTSTSADHLLAEGVSPERIVVTGNTVVEATRRMLPGWPERRQLLVQYALLPDAYVLATIHRPENTDDPERLKTVLQSLRELDQPVVLPLHPRTRACVQRFGLDHLLAGLQVVAPLGHPTFLGLAAHARLLVSDSGGVQEECTVLKRPLLVLRNSTERPEAVSAGFAQRVVPDHDLPEHLHAALDDHGWLARIANEPSPYGDGTASTRIIHAIDDLLLDRRSFMHTNKESER